jgi:hypothetical protein
MSSFSVRVAAVAMMLIQISIIGVYAPTHRLLHHTLARVETNQQSVSHSDGRTTCCHHGACASNPITQRLSAEESPDTPCSDDEGHCVWCLLALQQADLPIPVADTFQRPSVQPLFVIAGLIIESDDETAFDVRGPPSV